MQKPRSQKEIEDFQKAVKDFRDAFYTALGIEQVVKWIASQLEKIK